MDFRREEVAQVLTKFLERYSPPQRIRNNKDAQQAEAESLLKMLLRYAPKSDGGPWADRVLDVVAERMKTRVWPLPAEVGSVAKEFRQEQEAKPERRWSIDPISINAKRMEKGECVGDEWLYGRRAHELVESGLVTEPMIDSYRYDLFMEDKKTVGDELALKRDQERRSRHEGYYSAATKLLAAE